MNKIKFTIFIIIICLINNISQSKILIKYKVGEQIITNVDIMNERNYLIFLRPNLIDLPKDELLKISENSLIREVIKKTEINRLFKDLNNKLLIDEIKKKLFNFKKVENEKQFKKLLINTNIEYDKIIEKMKYEAFWNELIFRKYNALIRIDKEKLKMELETRLLNNKKYEYNISELLFEIEKNEKLEIKYEKIKKFINLNDFKSAVSRFSIANSSKSGGEIGWIKETLLSEKLNSILSKIKKNQITKPIKYPNGYLLSKINDKRELKQSISIEKELEELINYKKNEQLNQFSLLLYKKLKQNTVINEY